MICRRCEADKPDMAFPVRKGKRVGRICLACANERLSHKVRAPLSGRARYLSSLRAWICPTCGRRSPQVTPATTCTSQPIPSSVLCAGCHTRDRARRRKEQIS